MRRRVRRGFEPPAYIASLIGSINDGAKAAQTGGLTMLAVALYLVATVISTTDEVLLRGTFVQFSNIGVSVPVVASYALAPIVFLFLHVHTLIRYDMLAENLRLLDRELDTTLPRKEDQERCRQLLANVEFVQYWGSRPGSLWHAGLYKVVVWVMLVVIPILVFLATQISFLRYQDFFVTYVVHMGCLALDLAALVTFWYRQGRRKQDWQAAGRRRTLVLNAVPALALFAFAVGYLGIPPVESTTAGRQVDGYLQKTHRERAAWWHALGEGNWVDFAAASGRLYHLLRQYNPLDADLCVAVQWGCRYLRLHHRLLVEEKPDGEVLFKLRTGDGDREKLLVRVEALFLSGRSFRFADFAFSEFYDADFTHADLRHASLSTARLQGADFGGAHLQGANLAFAMMQGGNLDSAHLPGAVLLRAELRGATLILTEIQDGSLGDAQLQSVNLNFAKLQGANLQGTNLHGANLQGALLDGAHLVGTQLQGANLQDANLQGANLGEAKLQGADLSFANLAGANLGEAQLQGATLVSAKLRGANLQRANLWQTTFDRSELSGTDFRDIDLTPVSSDVLRELLLMFAVIPDENYREDSVKKVKNALTPRAPPTVLPRVGIEDGEPILVTSRKDPYFANVVHHLTTEVAVYDATIAPFLFGLARADPRVARSITARVIWSQGDDRSLWSNLARRLLAAEEAGAFTLDLDKDDRKTLKDLAARASKQPAAAPPAP